MEGRIYRLRRRNAVNYFGPAQYEEAGKHITAVKKYDAVKTVEVTTDNTNISPVLRAVLEHNGYTPEETNITNKKIKYTIKGTDKKRSDVLNLLQNMVNDSIKEIDFSTYSYPVGTSVNGVKVPLKDYTKEEAEKGNRGTVTIGQNNTESVGTSGEKSSPNWILIGGIAVIGIIVLLAVIKLIKK